MALQYVFDNETHLRRRAIAGSEQIREGEFVTQNGDGTISQFDPSSDDYPWGIIVHDPRGDAIVEHDEDYVQYSDLFTYDGSEGDRAYVAVLDNLDMVVGRTIDEQTSPASSAIDLTQDELVGIVILGSGETRIVPSGYTYDGTTYSEGGAGNFQALGRVEQQNLETRLSDGYAMRVPVRLDNDVVA